MTWVWDGFEGMWIEGCGGMGGMLGVVDWM